MIEYIFFVLTIVLIGVLFSYKYNECYSDIELDRCYPPVTIEFLKRYNDNKDINKLFDVEYVVNSLPMIDKAISCSLFCKDVNIHRESEENSPDMSENGKWYKKYMKPFIENMLDKFPQTEFYKNGWKMRLYLANDLGGKYIDMFSKYKYLEIYVMRSSSIGAVPGTFWRYLSYGDQTLDMVLVMDIDSPRIDGIYKSFKEFKKYPNHLMFKLDYGRPNVIGKDTDAVNNAVILGQRHFVRPRLLGLNDIKEIMGAFITYRSRMSNQFYGEKDRENVCNKPYEKHIYGWGNHYLMYCFDERFLKHVIFYYIVEKGGMVSLYDKKILYQYPEEYNYAMKANRNNVYIDQSA
jgi:hypothetical protein